MADFVKLYVDLLRSDIFQGAVAESPFASQALLWVMTRAGEQASGEVEVGEKVLSGGARLLNISRADLEAGIAALSPDWVRWEKTAGVLQIVDWNEMQSDYMRRCQRKADRAGTKSDNVRTVSEQCPPKPTACERQQKEPAPKAVAIRDSWNERRSALGLNVNDSARQTLKWIERRHGEGNDWLVLQRCVDRYFEECEAMGTESRYLYKIKNFFGEAAHYERYLADDWVCARPQKGGKVKSLEQQRKMDEYAKDIPF